MIGYVATMLTTSSVIPGIWRAWKRKSAGDLSLIQLWALELGIICWLIFGIQEQKLPIIIANSISAMLNGTMLFLRYRYGTVRR